MLGKVIYKANLAGNTWLLGIDLEENADFLPGQFVSLKVNEEGLRRSYSLASMPGGKKIELVIDVTPMGVGSKYIIGLDVGDTVEVLGFMGRFILNEESLKLKEGVIMVATGSGIVPFRPIIEELLVKRNYQGSVRLIWGMRYEKDLFWIKEIDKFQRDFDNFHFDIVLSKPGKDWPSFQGHVGDVILDMENNWEKTCAYLCGNQEMITEIKEVLLEKGIRDSRIFYERYT